MNKFPENLRILRKSRGMTLERLAKTIGRTHSAISSYEKNRTQPSIEDLIALANVFDCTVDDLVRGSDDTIITLGEHVPERRHEYEPAQVLEMRNLTQRLSQILGKTEVYPLQRAFLGFLMAARNTFGYTLA